MERAGVRTLRITAALALLVASSVATAACGSSSGPSAPPTATAATPSTLGEPPVSAGQAGSAGPASSIGGSSPTTPSTAAPSSAPTGPAGAGGCTAGGGPIPAGAQSRQVIDVDGDNRPDAAWISQDTATGAVTVGLLTASGGGFQRAWSSASPVTRSILVIRPNPATPPLVLASDGRLVQLWVVSGCALVDVTNKQGKPYEFGLGVTAIGTGVGCATVAGTNELVGLNEASRKNDAVSWSSTVVQVRGTAATNGTVTTGTYHLPADRAVVDALHAVTCGPLTPDRDGLTLPG